LEPEVTLDHFHRSAVSLRCVDNGHATLDIRPPKAVDVVANDVEKTIAWESGQR
jgi:hypothetical protein